MCEEVKVCGGVVCGLLWMGVHIGIFSCSHVFCHRLVTALGISIYLRHRVCTFLSWLWCECV